MSTRGVDRAVLSMAALERAGLCVVASLALACGRGAHEGASPDGTVRQTGRRVIERRWEEVFRVGGDVEDTLLQGPTALAADSLGVYVADAMAGRVLRFTRDGRLAYSTGRPGGGPGEFRRIRDLAVDDSGRVWVLDRGNSRITILDRTGAERTHFRLEQAARSADRVVATGPDRGAVLIVYDRERPFLRLGVDGRLRERFGPPWDGFSNLAPLASQLVAGGGPGGRWVAAFAMGDGYFVRDGDAWLGRRRRYVETVPFPRVEVRGGLSADGSGRVEERIAGEEPVFGALSLSVVGDRVVILFGGRTPERGRWLDVYDLAGGGYRGSLVLPEPFARVALGGGLLYGISSTPVPRLVGLRLRADSLP